MYQPIAPSDVQDLLLYNQALRETDPVCAAMRNSGSFFRLFSLTGIELIRNFFIIINKTFKEHPSLNTSSVTMEEVVKRARLERDAIRLGRWSRSLSFY